MKKDHSVVSQIPNRQQLLPYPPSKLSPKKQPLKPHKKNLKRECRILRWRPTTRSNNTSNKVYAKHHANLSEYEKQFHILINYSTQI